MDETWHNAVMSAGIDPLTVYTVRNPTGASRHASCRILLSQRSMDFIQVMRDRRWLADPDSAEQVNDAINVSVYRKIATAIQIGTDVEEPRDAAQLFVHMVSMRLPQYRRSDAFEGIAHDEIVRVFLQGIAAKVSPAQSTTVIEDAEPSEHSQIK